jgi:hypothetical protein
LLTVAGAHVPVIPFVDVVGRTGATDPLHIGATAANVGKMVELTVTSNVVVEPHCPGSGVNVYVPDAALLTVAGDHVPVIPFVEVVGRIGATDPLHIGAMEVNVGMMLEVTVTSSVFVDPHCPGSGVNVYVPDAALLTVAGAHVPVIPFVDVVGSIGAKDPLQIGATAVNVGIMALVTVTSSVVVVAH